MLRERFDAIIEELGEVQDLKELEALRLFGQGEGFEYADSAFASAFECAAARVGAQTPVQPVIEEVPTPVVVDTAAQIESLLRQIEELKRLNVAPDIAPTIKAGKKYRLLKTEVAWSTKPQVHAVMEILGAHAQVGDVLDEADIISMMVANEHILNTRQGGKRVWNYYKGDHVEGLVAHGNVEKV